MEQTQLEKARFVYEQALSQYAPQQQPQSADAPRVIETVETETQTDKQKLELNEKNILIANIENSLGMYVYYLYVLYYYIYLTIYILIYAIGLLLTKMSIYTDAEKYLQSASSSFQKLYQPQPHVSSLSVLSNLSSLYMQTKRYEKALSLSLECLEGFQLTLGKVLNKFDEFYLFNCLCLD